MLVGRSVVDKRFSLGFSVVEEELSAQSQHEVTNAKRIVGHTVLQIGETLVRSKIPKLLLYGHFHPVVGKMAGAGI